MTGSRADKDAPPQRILAWRHLFAVVSQRSGERNETDDTRRPRPIWRIGAATLAAVLLSAASAARADKIALCHAGVVTLVPFAKHVKFLRSSKRYTAEDVAELVARQRKGGPDFFSSQIIVQEEVSGSGTFDLRRIHGLETAKYRNVTAWACEADDYPITYFVGFRVREIEDGVIAVSREKDIVNVISLKTLDPDLKNHLQVKMKDSGEPLCRDLAEGCIDRIFYDRY